MADGERNAAELQVEQLLNYQKGLRWNQVVPTTSSAMDSFGFSQFCISQALKESVSDIRGTLEGSSLKVFPSIVKVSLSLKLTLKVFQDCVEVHMQHIQQGLRLELLMQSMEVSISVFILFFFSA